MKLKSQIMGLLAETFVHVGTGQVMGAVDLPVAREAATDYPLVPGSGVKGALREVAETTWGETDPRVAEVFGGPDSAGGLLVSDARLLLLPVRSLQSSYCWLTCPYLLERLQRDLKRSGYEAGGEAVLVEPGRYLGPFKDKLFLEERSFTKKNAVPDWVIAQIRLLVPHASTQGRLEAQVVVLSDQDFAWYARYGLAVQAHNVLDEKKQSKNLFYEEALPPDTLLYCILSERSAGSIEQALGLFSEHPYIRLGGNETTGQGWMALSIGNPTQGTQEVGHAVAHPA